MISSLIKLPIFLSMIVCFGFVVPNSKQCIFPGIAMLMDLVPSDKESGLEVPIWDEYKKILNEVHVHANFGTCAC